MSFLLADKTNKPPQKTALWHYLCFQTASSLKKHYKKWNILEKSQRYEQKKAIIIASRWFFLQTQ